MLPSSFTFVTWYALIPDRARAHPAARDVAENPQAGLRGGGGRTLDGAEDVGDRDEIRVPVVIDVGHQRVLEQRAEEVLVVVDDLRITITFEVEDGAAVRRRRAVAGRRAPQHRIVHRAIEETAAREHDVAEGARHGHVGAPVALEVRDGRRSAAGGPRGARVPRERAVEIGVAAALQPTILLPAFPSMFPAASCASAKISVSTLHFCTMLPPTIEIASRTPLFR